MKIHLLLSIIMILPLRAMEIELSNEQFNAENTRRLFIHISHSNIGEIINFIKDQQADPNAILSYADNEGHVTPLQHALATRYISSGEIDTSIIEILIQLGADIEKKNSKSDNYTPLQSAAAYCDPNAILLLLSKNANVHASEEDDLTPLYIICKTNPRDLDKYSVERVIEKLKYAAQLLLNAGALIKPETTTADPIPLVLASAHHNHFLIPILLKHGTDINAGNPLIFAAKAAHKTGYTSDAMQTIRTLLKEGANPYQQEDTRVTFKERAATFKDIQTEYRNWKKQHKKAFDQQEAFLETARAGELRNITIRSDFNFSFINKFPALPLEIIKRIFDLMDMPWTGQNYLDLYQKKFMKRELRKLLVQKDQSDDTPLEEKIKSYCTQGFPGREILGRPPLHWILKQTNDVQVLDQFVKAGLAKNETDASGNTLLHTAVLFQKITPALLEYLKEMINIGDNYGVTPLGASVLNRDDNCSTAQALIEAGADIHAKTQTNETMLHLAAISGNIHMIQFFMKQGLAIDARDNKSNTPLHTYLEQNRKDDDAKEVLELFFEAGAPLEAQNTDNQNCIELAQKKGIHIITLHREWHARINPSLKDKAKKKIAKLSSSIFGKKKE